MLSFESFISQAFNRVRQCCTDRLPANGYECNYHRQSSGQRKRPYADIYMIGEIRQPLMHHIPCDRNGNQKADSHKFQKVF